MRSRMAGKPTEEAVLDYLRKYWQHGWTWRELLRDRPSVVIPDGMGLRGPSKGAWNAIKEFDGRGSVLLATATTALILGLVSCS